MEADEYIRQKLITVRVVSVEERIGQPPKPERATAYPMHLHVMVNWKTVRS